jgi:hypothetical protein
MSSPSILDMKCRAVLGPRFAAVVKPGGRDVGVPEPLLHFGNIRLVRKRVGGGRPHHPINPTAPLPFTPGVRQDIACLPHRGTSGSGAQDCCGPDAPFWTPAPRRDSNYGQRPLCAQHRVPSPGCGTAGELRSMANVNVMDRSQGGPNGHRPGFHESKLPPDPHLHLGPVPRLSRLDQLAVRGTDHGWVHS